MNPETFDVPRIFARQPSSKSRSGSKVRLCRDILPMRMRPPLAADLDAGPGRSLVTFCDAGEASGGCGVRLSCGSSVAHTVQRLELQVEK
jgi:hypothetical protein